MPFVPRPQSLVGIQGRLLPLKNGAGFDLRMSMDVPFCFGNYFDLDLDLACVSVSFSFGRGEGTVLNQTPHPRLAKLLPAL